MKIKTLILILLMTILAAAKAEERSEDKLYLFKLKNLFETSDGYVALVYEQAERDDLESRKTVLEMEGDVAIFSSPCLKRRCREDHTGGELLRFQYRLKLGEELVDLDQLDFYTISTGTAGKESTGFRVQFLGYHRQKLMTVDDETFRGFSILSLEGDFDAPFNEEATKGIRFDFQYQDISDTKYDGKYVGSGQKIQVGTSYYHGNLSARIYGDFYNVHMDSNVFGEDHHELTYGEKGVELVFKLPKKDLSIYVEGGKRDIELQSDGESVKKEESFYKVGLKKTFGHPYRRVEPKPN